MPKFSCSRYATAVSCILLFTWIGTSARAADAVPALTLTEATARTLAHNPSLKSQAWQLKRVTAERDNAALRPALSVDVEAENFLGTHAARNYDDAETTLSLSSTFELGNKRRARTRAADTEVALLTADTGRVTRERVLQVKRQFIETLAMQEQWKLAQATRDLAQTAVVAVRDRLGFGAASAADLWQAEAKLAQADIDLADATADLAAKQRLLASFWGERSPDFTVLAGDLFTLDAIADFPLLRDQLARSPLAHQRLLALQHATANAALADSETRADIGWSLGVRHMQDTGSSALVAGISVPLVSKQRGANQRLAAKAELESVRLDNEASALALENELYHAWQQYQGAQQTAIRLARDILPALEKSLALTHAGWQRGRYRHADWALARAAWLDARLAQVENARRAQLELAHIENLIGAPLPAPGNTLETQP